MRRWCHAGMGWSVVISCFCKMGKQICSCAVQLCYAPLEWDCLEKKWNLCRLPHIPKKPAEHLVMKIVTKNALKYQHSVLVELRKHLCGMMLWGNWTLFCNRLYSASVCGLQKVDCSFCLCCSFCIWASCLFTLVYICRCQAFSWCTSAGVSS